jgi:hypothetical protein
MMKSRKVSHGRGLPRLVVVAIFLAMITTVSSPSTTDGADGSLQPGKLGVIEEGALAVCCQ